MIVREMEIRLITPEECSALADITVEAYRHVNGSTSLGDYEEELRAVDRRRLSAEVYVALDDAGVLMGGVTYVPGPESPMAEFTDPEAAGIRMLAVSPHFQGRGAGRALVQRCVARAIELHRERIILHSAPSMTLAQSMYVKMGFVRAPDLDEWIREDSEKPREPLHLRAYVLNVPHVP
jgi:ribosomal protein S18 acetylase RimI-like enzyme